MPAHGHESVYRESQAEREPSGHARRTPDSAALAPGGRTDPPDSPWQTLAAAEVYRNPWIAVTEYAVRRPDGTRGIYGVVNPGDNVSVVALDDDGYIYLVGAFLYPLQRYEWTIPSGKVEEGEQPEQAAQRELAEEAGVEADRWESLGAYALSPGVSTQISYLFLARDLTRVPPRPEATELLAIQRLPLPDAFASCLRGDLSSAVTALGILRTWLALHGGGGA
jgi:8-oxo-dGTP pyrophosphatase MutT (NUDIX family)